MKLYTEEKIKNAYTQIWCDGGHDKYSLNGLEKLLEILNYQEKNEIDLNDKYAFSKKILKDKDKLETMLIFNIRQICHEYGYILSAIKIDQITTQEHKK